MNIDGIFCEMDRDTVADYVATIEAYRSLIMRPDLDPAEAPKLRVVMANLRISRAGVRADREAYDRREQLRATPPEKIREYGWSPSYVEASAPRLYGDIQEMAEELAGLRDAKPGSLLMTLEEEVAEARRRIAADPGRLRMCGVNNLNVALREVREDAAERRLLASQGR
ncbi:MAG TPA: hypothetical protein VHQ47_07495 [Phycisphaerae bacterium]|nr:hypothetical protein [Phycisphaerae bacterium]